MPLKIKTTLNSPFLKRRKNDCSGTRPLPPGSSKQIAQITLTPITTMLILIFFLYFSAADRITQFVFSLDDVSINSSLPGVFRHLVTEV